MEENLTQKAIECALNLEWAKAIDLNIKILEDDPNDVDALNRLAKAYFESNNIKKAITTSQKVLKIDESNNIAKNALIRYKQKTPLRNSQSKIVNFIEEAGKTKITTLINLGSEKVYSCLYAGEEVRLVTHAHKVSVTTENNEYIGKLADDISARLRRLIKDGHKYNVFIKSVAKKQVKVFIKGDTISFFPREQSESFSEFRA